MMYSMMPKVGQSIRVQCRCRHDCPDNVGVAIQQAAEHGAKMVIDEICKKMTTIKTEIHHGFQSTLVTVDVVVMSEQELQDALTKAYQWGLIEGRRSCAQTW